MTPKSQVGAAVYKLGRIAFTIDDGTSEFLNQLEILLPSCPNAKNGEVQHVRSNDLRELQNQIFQLHGGCLWLDAGCLITPNGKRVLIVGRSGAGKSTTTMALALAFGWKVVAEDILLIDYEKDELITFGAPFSLKPGTKELLQEAIGKVPNPIINLEWSPLGKMAARSGAKAHFDVCIVFSRSYDDEPKLRITNLSPAEFLRKCLPISNVLRMNGASEKLLEYVSAGERIEIEDGSVRERLDKIATLCK